MILYVLEQQWNEYYACKEFMGVYSTLDKAKQAVPQLLLWDTEFFPELIFGRDSDGTGWTIYQVELDKQGE